MKQHRERLAGLLHVAARREGLAVVFDHAARHAGHPYVLLQAQSDPAKVVGRFESAAAAIDFLGKAR